MSKKVKQIPKPVIKEYISLDKKMDALKPKIEALKADLRRLYAAGFTTDLLEFIESSPRKVDWKLVVTELCEKYMTSREARGFYRNLRRRFPRKPIAPTIKIVGKKRKSSKSSSEGEK